MNIIFAKGSVLPQFRLLVMFLLLGLSAAAQAVTPTTMNYQGYLTDSAGTPVDTTVDIEFRLYTSETGGAPFWSETQSVPVSKGLFTVALGSVTSLMLPDDFNTPLWLGVKVVFEVDEMAPRQALTLTAFAVKAMDADALEGRSAASLDQSVHVTDTGNPHGVTAAQANAVSSGAFIDHAGNASAHHVKTTSFDDITGGRVQSGQIQDNAVTGAKISDGTIAPADVGFNYAGSSTKDGPASDINCVGCVSSSELDFTTGDITAVTAGTGLSGGGVTGAVSLGVEVPLSLTGSIGGGPIIFGTNDSASGHGLLGVGTGGIGVIGASSSSSGVFGSSQSGLGVQGFTTTGSGVFGTNSTSSNVGYLGTLDYGVHGSSGSNTGTGVEGNNTAGGAGVIGRSSTGYGGYFTSSAGPGLIVGSGNVGIGTTSPKQSLHVNGDYYGRGHFYLHAFEGDGSSGTAYLQARDDSGTSSISMALRTQNAGSTIDAMTLSNSGNVGIGTTSPASKLEVAGNLTVNGKIEGTARGIAIHLGIPACGSDGVITLQTTCQTNLCAPLPLFWSCNSNCDQVLPPTCNLPIAGYLVAP